MIRICIVDDHHLFREGITKLLKDDPRFNVVGSFRNGQAFIEQFPRLKVDVVIMDINMPELDGIQTTQKMMKMGTTAKVLMLTISEQDQDLFAAIRAGAHGYVLKNATTEELSEAILRTHLGESMITPKMARRLLEEFRLLSSPTVTPPPEYGSLSDREITVLQKVALGLSNKEIGQALAISPHTVKAHIHTILDKLHLKSRAEAAAWATAHGISKPENTQKD